MFLFVPEVKGLSLEEVDEMYRAKIRPWKSSGWRPSYELRGGHAVRGGRRVVGGEIVVETEGEKQEVVTANTVDKTESDTKLEKAWYVLFFLASVAILAVFEDFHAHFPPLFN